MQQLPYSVCFQCNTKLNKNEPIYQVCDASLCSENCKKIRLNLINDIDPHFSNPEYWLNIKNYRDVSTLQNQYPQIFQNQHSLLRTNTSHLITVVSNETRLHKKSKKYFKRLGYVFTSCITIGVSCISCYLLIN